MDPDPDPDWSPTSNSGSGSGKNEYGSTTLLPTGQADWALGAVLFSYWSANSLGLGVPSSYWSANCLWLGVPSSYWRAHCLWLAFSLPIGGRTNLERGSLLAKLHKLLLLLPLLQVKVRYFKVCKHKT